MARRRPARPAAVFLAAAAVLFACAAAAAPKAESPAECGVAADMAVVARSLAEERVQQAKAGAIMSRIYDVAASQRAKELMDDILAAAYSGTEEGSSHKFARDLFAACMKSGGDMNPILGQRL
ncbi:MAG TPA: hypothetical protein VFB08_05150 [Burkholderiales bacterium]|nr:hypothetical protein [Burkholderiales bacterium]